MNWLKGGKASLRCQIYIEPKYSDLSPNEISLMNDHVRQWMMLPIFNLVVTNFLNPDIRNNEIQPLTTLTQRREDGMRVILNAYKRWWIDVA